MAGHCWAEHLSPVELSLVELSSVAVHGGLLLGWPEDCSPVVVAAAASVELSSGAVHAVGCHAAAATDHNKLPLARE